MIQHYRKLFVYNAWANRETLASLQAMHPAAAPALRLFSHVLAAEKLWLTRLRRISTTGFPVWPDHALAELAAEARESETLWSSYLDGLTTEMLLYSISYVNTKGEEWRNTVSEILDHVIIHSGYHRGQVAAEIRKAGGEPSYTDYIHAVRQGMLTGQIPDGGRH